MGVWHARGAVYDLKSHLAWVPKYLRIVLRGTVTQRLKGVFARIAARYESAMNTQEVMDNHVHLFLSVPRPGLAEVVRFSRVYFGPDHLPRVSGGEVSTMGWGIAQRQPNTPIGMTEVP